MGFQEKGACRTNSFYQGAAEMGTGRLKKRVPGKNKDWGRNSKGQSRGCRGSLEQQEGARAEEPLRRRGAPCEE